MFFLRPIGVDDDIVHVDRSLATVNEFHELIINHCLESGWGIGEAKEHDGWFEQPVTSFKGGLPFVAFFNADIVIPPSDVEFGKPPFTRNAVNELRYEGEGISVRDCPLVQLAVVLYRPQFSILFLDKEKATCVQRLGAADPFQP